MQLIQLSQKERMLLEDDRHQEEICVKKYQSYAQQAQDQQLSQLFNQLATEEQKHYDTLTQLLAGQAPNLGQGQQAGMGQQSGMGQQGMQAGQGQMTAQAGQLQQPFKQAGAGTQADALLCGDLLSTEKYVSGTYDTAIFEATNPMVRQALQHIQKDEQRHGQLLFEYMQSHGMYNVK